MKLYLIRHGETDWNAKKKLQGHTDTEINIVGEEQAHALANELQSLGIKHIVSSDLKRAAQTASIIVSALNVPLHTDKRLRECNFGKYEGMSWNDIESEYNIKKSDYFTGENRPYDFSHVGGENREAVLLRQTTLLNELKKQFPKETILLVGHGTNLNTLLAALGYSIGLQRGEFRKIDY